MYPHSIRADSLTRLQHGAPNEHKGPTDFNGGDDDDDEDGDGTPPRGNEMADHHPMMPPQYHGGNVHPNFPQIRYHTASASPPISNGTTFPSPHMNQRAYTPQPHPGSRPNSQNDIRRPVANMVPHSLGPQPQPPASYAMPTPPLTTGPPNPPGLISQPGQSYSYGSQQPSYMDDRRPPAPPAYIAPPPPRITTGPPPAESIPTQPSIHMSPPPPQVDRRSQEPPPFAPMESRMAPRMGVPDRRQPLLLNTDSAIKKNRKSHSIFTPVEENRSILSQHLASFAAETPGVKPEPGHTLMAAPTSRAHSVDAGSRGKSKSSSPPVSRDVTLHGFNDKPRAAPMPTVPENSFAPPSRTDSLKTVASGARPRGPRLTVQIPDGASEAGSGTPGDSNSPLPPVETLTPSQGTHRMVLPPPSPSASALLSAGATGPPNPFARPPPQQNVNNDTPVSALPSRFLNNEFLPSPSGFYQDWNFRNGDNNNGASPLNFATPVVGTGPSFLRDDHSHSSVTVTNTTPNHSASTTTTTSGPGSILTAASTALKRKSPDLIPEAHRDGRETPSEVKRVKIEA